MVSNVQDSATSAEAGEPVTVEAELIDPDVETVELRYTTNGSERSAVAMEPVGGTEYQGEIPGQPVATRVSFHVEAEDPLGQQGFSAERTYQVGGSQAGTSSLILSEVFYDHTNSDDGEEWVELFNAGSTSINLSGYSLGNGGSDYTYSKVQLSGTIGSKQFFVVGGPDRTAENGNPTYNQAEDFDPDFQNADGASTADGVALFHVPAAQVTASTVPIDAVINGGVNSSGLKDGTGSTGSPQVSDVAAGFSIQRTSIAGGWEANAHPNPGGSPYFPAEADPNLIFPHWLNGLAAGQPNRTRIVLRNNSNEEDTGTIRFMDAGGSPVSVPVSGSTADTVAYTLVPWGTFEVETAGTGALLTGTIDVVSNRGVNSVIEGTEVFEVLGNFVSIPSAPPRSMSQIYASVTSAENTGVALYNPDRQNAVTVNAILVDSSGVQRASRLIEIEPGQQQLSFVDQAALFSDYFSAHPGSFRGTLNLFVQGQGSISVLGLLQKRQSGALIAIAGSDSAYNP